MKIRIPLIFLILSVVSFASIGKETLCYKLIETNDRDVKNGAIQFITFIGDICFDSDKQGVSIKNGNLNRNTYQSSNDIIIYEGSSFCGNKTKYEFKNNKSTLLVKSSTNKTYRFTKITAPSNIKTSSLKKANSTQPQSESNGLYSPVNPSYPSSPGITNSSNSKSSRDTSTSEKRHKCHYCNGKGRRTFDENAPASFGIEKAKKRCNECGKVYDPTYVNHYHLECSHCHGKGYVVY